MIEFKAFEIFKEVIGEVMFENCPLYREILNEDTDDGI
jgi:hypothetical protein